jgi:predicted translin family RNA/ssDNA-binding protein
MTKNLHPSVEKFKRFVKKHPKIIQEVRKGHKTWKEFYEDWYLFGEEDEIWNQYKEEKREQKTESSNFMNKIVSTLKNMDVNEMQQHIASVQEAISAIQNVIGQFQGMKQSQSSSAVPHEHHPFSFRKD